MHNSTYFFTWIKVSSYECTKLQGLQDGDLEKELLGVSVADRAIAINSLLGKVWTLAHTSKPTRMLKNARSSLRYPYTGQGGWLCTDDHAILYATQSCDPLWLTGLHVNAESLSVSIYTLWWNEPAERDRTIDFGIRKMSKQKISVVFGIFLHIAEASGAIPARGQASVQGGQSRRHGKVCMPGLHMSCGFKTFSLELLWI